MTGGWLRHILVSSDYDVLTPVSQIFSCSFLSLIQFPIIHVFSSFTSNFFFISLQLDPSKTEMSAKIETALQFPTAADLKDLQEVEGKFSGESLFYGFASILYAVPL